MRFVKKCVVEGCENVHNGRGLCKEHYTPRKYKAYKPRKKQPTVFCSIHECGKQHYGLGLCRWHYDNKRRAGNPEYGRLSSLAYRSKPENRAKSKAYRQATAHKKLEYDRAYRAANREKVRAVGANKCARRRGAEGKYTEKEIQALFLKQRGKCAVCRDKLGSNYHRDHIVPIVLGGSSWITNIQLLCQPCNLEKSYKHPIAFMQSRGMLL